MAKSKKSGGMMVGIGLLVLGGIAAAWYFLSGKPDKQGKPDTTTGTGATNVDALEPKTLVRQSGNIMVSGKTPVGGGRVKWQTGYQANGNCIKRTVTYLGNGFTPAYGEWVPC